MSFGDNPIPFSEIESWIKLSEISLTLWEIETIKSFSNTYLLALQEYDKKGVIAPYITEERLEFLRQRYAQDRLAMMRARHGKK